MTDSPAIREPADVLLARIVTLAEHINGIARDQLQSIPAEDTAWRADQIELAQFSGEISLLAKACKSQLPHDLPDPRVIPLFDLNQA